MATATLSYSGPQPRPGDVIRVAIADGEITVRVESLRRRTAVGLGGVGVGGRQVVSEQVLLPGQLAASRTSMNADGIPVQPHTHTGQTLAADAHDRALTQHARGEAHPIGHTKASHASSGVLPLYSTVSMDMVVSPGHGERALSAPEPETATISASLPVHAVSAAIGPAAKTSDPLLTSASPTTDTAVNASTDIDVGVRPTAARGQHRLIPLRQALRTSSLGDAAAVAVEAGSAASLDSAIANELNANTARQE